MSDADRALAAASVLLTLVALLYSLWYAALTEAALTPPAPEPMARPIQAAGVRLVLRSKALPLIVAAGLPVLVFAPVAVGVVTNFLSVIGSRGVDALASYDVVQAAFEAVYLLASMLFVISLSMGIGVARRERLLMGSRSQQ